MDGLLVATLTLTAQRDFSQVEIKALPVSGTVSMLEGAGGNIGVSAGPDGVLIVDDQFAPLAEKIAAKLKELNPASPRFVLNTHWHGDHTGGNAFFGERGANIIAHANVRKRLSEKSDVKPRNSRCSPTSMEPPFSSMAKRSGSWRCRPAIPMVTVLSSSRAPTSCTWATSSSRPFPVH